MDSPGMYVDLVQDFVPLLASTGNPNQVLSQVQHYRSFRSYSPSLLQTCPIGESPNRPSRHPAFRGFPIPLFSTPRIPIGRNFSSTAALAETDCWKKTLLQPRATKRFVYFPESGKFGTIQAALNFHLQIFHLQIAVLKLILLQS